jgi:hypothetical protein
VYNQTRNYPFAGNSYDLILGSVGDLSGYFMNGKLDNFRLYNASLPNDNLAILNLYNNITSTSKVQLTNNFKAYPNPAKDRFNLSLPFPSNIQVINSQGQVVFSQLADKDISISTMEFPNGLYKILAEGCKPQNLVVNK